MGDLRISLHPQIGMFARSALAASAALIA